MKFLLLLIVLLIPMHAFSFDLTCPDSLKTKQKIASKIPTEWTPLVDIHRGKNSFDRVRAYSGHPKEGADLVPDDGGNLKYSVWTFHEKNGTSNWIACSYKSTDMQLIQKLPPKTKVCRADYGKLPVRVSCSYMKTVASLSQLRSK